ncbi:MAG: hypothetical protein HY323_08030 [Betaproteobacteria bacterium]|nr:hypothetical protein [Betaproteobacteria bacterium]
MTIEASAPRQGPRAIALVAYGATKIIAPWDDKSWTIWSLNDAYAHFATRLSALFEMHPIKHYTDHAQYVEDHEKRMSELTCDVWLAFPNPKIPNAKIYPLEKIIPYGRDYFCSTLPYMIGMAIHQIKTYPNTFLPKIGLWGCDMQLTSEYAKERACVEYWCGRAEGHGIEVVIPDDSPILKAGYRYGYDQERVEARKRILDARDRDLRVMLEGANRGLALAQEQVANLNGMRSEVAFMQVNLTDAVPAGQAVSIVHNAQGVRTEMIE